MHATASLGDTSKRERVVLIGDFYCGKLYEIFRQSLKFSENVESTVPTSVVNPQAGPA